jgi:hypothetical protein
MLTNQFLEMDFYVLISQRLQNYEINFSSDRCRVTFYRDEDGTKFVSKAPSLNLQAFIEPENVYLSLVQCLQNNSQQYQPIMYPAYYGTP